VQMHYSQSMVCFDGLWGQHESLLVVCPCIFVCPLRLVVSGKMRVRAKVMQYCFTLLHFTLNLKPEILKSATRTLNLDP
jgi:hypothetical protein